MATTSPIVSKSNGERKSNINNLVDLDRKREDWKLSKHVIRGKPALSSKPPEFFRTVLFNQGPMYLGT